MIEVSIAKDKAFNSLSEFAQLLFLKILPHTDDYGRMEGDPETVKVIVDGFSKRKAADYEAAMAEIAKAGLWIWYETDKGKRVVQFKEDAFNRINAFMVKRRGQPEYLEYQDSYKLISSDIGAISHIKQQAESRKQKATTFVPPELPEVVKFFSEHGFPESLAKRAYEHYNVANWHDAKGNKVKNWKQKMISVWLTEKNKTEGPTETRGYL